MDLQTRDGYLWLATEEGLVRFSGVRFTVCVRQTYTLRNSRRTPRHSTKILPARYGSAVMAVVLTRLKDGALRTSRHEQGLSDNSINSISESPDGKLVITTFPGILSILRWRAVSRDETARIPTQQNLSQLSRDKQGRLWIGWNKGSFFWTRKEQGFTKRPIPEIGDHCASRG